MREFIAIEPRYDDSYLGKDNTFDQTYADGLYDMEWEDAINYARKGNVFLITIYSWNEYHERSQIEPSTDRTSAYQNDPYYIYNETKYYIDILKNPPFPTEAVAAVIIITAVVVIVIKKKSTWKRALGSNS